MLKINVRSVRDRPITGVQRYTNEVIKQLGIEYDLIDAPKYLKNGFQGHAWEQTLLAWKLKQSQQMLWSPSNTGPMRCKNQIVTIHDMAVLDHPEWFNKKYVKLYKFVLPELVKSVQHILTVSEFSKRRIHEMLHVPLNKITALPLAADKSFCQRKRDENIDFGMLFDLPERYVLSVGSLEPRKNIRLIIDAWSRWADRPKHLRLLIVGSSGRIFAQAQHANIPDSVIFTGRVSDEILPLLYSFAEFFVYPSLYEGFGLPPLEAMSSGTPVITSGLTSIKEVVGDSALYVDPFSTDSLISAFKTLSNDSSARQEYIDKGLERSKNFSWQRTGQDTARIIHKFT